MSNAATYSGYDPDTNDEYQNPDALWNEARAHDGGLDGWYKTSVDYWDKQEASVDGVLGGFGFVSDADIRESRAFLLKVCRKHFAAVRASGENLVAVDCGAGVGRVTEQLLLHEFDEVDVLEPSGHLLAEAKRKLAAPVKGVPAGHRAANFFQYGLEKFEPQAGRYDVIWIQWALLYLTDDDLVALLRRCFAGLKAGGAIFVKENVCRDGFVVDKDDSSLTRSHVYLQDLFKRAGGRLAASALQKDFPKELYKVRMYALLPPLA